MRATFPALTLAAILIGGAALPAQEAEKRSPGIYLAAPGQNAAETLTRLIGGRAREVKSKGMLKMVLSQGIAKGSFAAELSGPQSDVRTKGSPTFYFYLDSAADKSSADSPEALLSMMSGGDSLPAGARNASDFVLIRLTVNKDGNREGEIGKMTGTGSPKSKDAVATNVERLAQGEYLVTPKGPLGPGEYAFYCVVNGGAQGNSPMWDFGIDR